MVAVSEERIQVANTVMQEAEEESSALCKEIHNIVHHTLDTLVSEGSLSVVERGNLSYEYTRQSVEMLKNISNVKK